MKIMSWHLVTTTYCTVSLFFGQRQKYGSLASNWPGWLFSDKRLCNNEFRGGKRKLRCACACVPVRARPVLTFFFFARAPSPSQRHQSVVFRVDPTPFGCRDFTVL